MPYYQGDYYRGDYYRGDPGIFDVFKKVGKAVGGAVAGFARGGPVGAITGAAAAVTGRQINLPPPGIPAISPPFAMVPSPGGRQGINVPAGFGVPEPGVAGAIQRFLPGGQTGYGAAPPGYHINKAYIRYLRAQEQGRSVENPFNEPRAVNLIVRNRSMNPLNPQALRRTVRRQRAAVGLMRAVLAGSGYTIKRQGLPGKAKRRRASR